MQHPKARTPRKKPVKRIKKRNISQFGLPSGERRMSQSVGRSTAQDRRKRRHNLIGSAYNWEREETRAQSGPLRI